MVSKISVLAALTLLLETAHGSNVHILDFSCKLKQTPPAGVLCGSQHGDFQRLGSYGATSAQPFINSPEECAVGCAQDSGCKTSYYATSVCYWDSLTTTEAGWYENVSPFSAYDFSCFDCKRTAICPRDDGAHFYVGQTPFAIRCGTDFYGGDLVRVDAETFTDCMESCASTMGCVDVAYRGTNCYLKSSATSARQDLDVQGAILVSVEDTQKNRLSCPASDGAIYTSPSGDAYDIHCGVDYYGGDVSSLPAETFEDCLDACSSTTGCVDVALHAKYCYLKGDVSDVRSNSDVWGARKQVQNKRRSVLRTVAKNAADRSNLA